MLFTEDLGTNGLNTCPDSEVKKIHKTIVSKSPNFLYNLIDLQNDIRIPGNIICVI